MQDDDTANPGMLWVLQGEPCGPSKAEKPARSCADCHGNARVSMKKVSRRVILPSTQRSPGRSISSSASTAAPEHQRPRRWSGKAQICWR